MHSNAVKMASPHAPPLVSGLKTCDTGVRISLLPSVSLIRSGRWVLDRGTCEEIGMGIGD
jgi:hypothetical protein